jgi:hypothetical protein
MLCMNKRILLFLLTIIVFPALTYGQSILGTWHSKGVLMLSESAKEQKLIITKDSIHIISRHDQYSYIPSTDTNDEYEKTVNGDTTEVHSIKIISVIPGKMSDRAHMVILTPSFASSKKKPSYTAMRYTFIDDDHCKLSVALEQEFKTKKEIEKVYTGLKYYDMFYLVSEKKAAEYIRMKDPKAIPVEDFLSVLKDVYEYCANYSARIDKDKNEGMMIEILSDVSERISQSLELLGYNPMISMDDIEDIMKKYKEDPRVKKISDDIDQIMEKK